MVIEGRSVLWKKVRNREEKVVRGNQIEQSISNPSDEQLIFFFTKSVSSQTCVTSDPLNDRINAEEYEMWRRSGSGPKELQNQIHLTLSATFPNLQVSTSKRDGHTLNFGITVPCKINNNNCLCNRLPKMTWAYWKIWQRNIKMLSSGQVWSLTQFYCVNFSNLRSVLISAFSTNAQSRFVSPVVFDMLWDLRN